VGEVARVPYQDLADGALRWAAEHDIPPAAEDRIRICLMAVDLQNTFCLPGFELFVAGRSGSGAVEDVERLCRFVYANLGRITRIVPTMDTHRLMQIFHPLWLVDEGGEHPSPYTQVSVEDVEQGRWRFDPRVAPGLHLDPDYAQRQLLHYVQRLAAGGKYRLTVWPYHAMLGGIGHALVPAFEEAVFFHAVARLSQPGIHLKGDVAASEHYSVLGPEVPDGPDGRPLASPTASILETLREYDALVIAGEAKSHCVAWTVDDILRQVLGHDPRLAGKVYLLEDCTSPVVVPGILDYTAEADAAFARFAAAGMHLVRSTQPVDTWPGLGR
jgi:nicotinamidase-related amidase